MILFKYPKKQRQLAKVDPKLRKIVAYIEQWAWENFSDDIVITSIFRRFPKSSVHAWYRGVDIAILENGGLVGSEWVRQVVNREFAYGKDGVETVPALRHGNSPHIHVQTIAREG